MSLLWLSALLLLPTLAACAPAPAPAPSITQKSYGSQSPAIAYVGGNVTVTYGLVPAQVEAVVRQVLAQRQEGQFPGAPNAPPAGPPRSSQAVVAVHYTCKECPSDLIRTIGVRLRSAPAGQAPAMINLYQNGIVLTGLSQSPEGVEISVPSYRDKRASNLLIANTWKALLMLRAGDVQSVYFDVSPYTFNFLEEATGGRALYVVNGAREGSSSGPNVSVY